MGRRATAFYLILPSFLLAAFIILWPLKEIVNLALHDVNRFGLLRAFSGLTNFRVLFADPDFLAALWRTLVWTVAVVGGTLVVSVPVALMLNDDFYGRSIARIIVMLPWAVSLTMTAIVWRWALSGESGMLNSGLKSLGLIDANIQWLAEASTAFPIQILIGIQASIPFTTTIFLGGLSSVPDELYDAAAIEGAGRWDQFRYITLPLLRPFINIAIVLNTIYVFNSFPIIYTLNDRNPGFAHDTSITFMYKLAFKSAEKDVGMSAAAGLFNVALILLVVVVYLRLLKWREETPS